MKRWVWSPIAAIFALAACARQPCEGDAQQSKGPTVRIDVSLATCNAAPVAEIIALSAIEKKKTLVLDASASTDANNDPLTFSWKLLSQPDGSSAELEGPTAKVTSFTPAVSGYYVVSLTANDGEISSVPEEVSLFVKNNVPVAIAGEDFAWPVGSVAMLDGSMSVDADGDPLTYTWTLDQRPAGSTAQLDSPTSATPRFTVDVAGVYAFSLVVNDGEDDSMADIVRVGGGVMGTRPVARAGADQVGVLGQTVRLTGSASSDPDGAPLTYSWRFVEQPQSSAMNMATLSDATTEFASFVPVEVGNYVVELIVNDGFFDSLPSTMTVIVDYGTGEPGALCELAGCKQDTTCFEGTCVGSGALRFSLSWTVISDFDLHVQVPGGLEIFYGNPMAAGGELDVDDCVGNVCRSAATHVENIVFTGDPTRGTYLVWVENFNGGGSGSFTIEVSGRVRQTILGTLPAMSGIQSLKTQIVLP